jgi:hypothetical protein
MLVKVIDHDFIKQAVHCPPDRCNKVQYFGAVRVALQPSLDSAHLTADAPYPRQKVVFTCRDMCHNIPPYPMLLRCAISL